MHANELVEKWLSSHRRGRLAHAFILSGPSQSSKSQAVLALLQNLLCERHLACGECGACIRLARNSSENMLSVKPDGASIKIEQVRMIREFLSFEASAPARAVVIESAELMGIAASNALLKILEEPPPGVYFFLLASSAAALPSTIRSRSQCVYLAGETEEAEPMALEISEVDRLLDQLQQNLLEGLRLLRSQLTDRETSMQLLRAMQSRVGERLREGVESPVLINNLYLAQALLALESHLRSQIDPQLAFENAFIGVSQNA